MDLQRKPRTVQACAVWQGTEIFLLSAIEARMHTYMWPRTLVHLSYLFPWKREIGEVTPGVMSIAWPLTPQARWERSLEHKYWPVVANIWEGYCLPSARRCLRIAFARSCCATPVPFPISRVHASFDRKLESHLRRRVTVNLAQKGRNPKSQLVNFSR